jgi:PAS domain S-box-containing protein
VSPNPQPDPAAPDARLVSQLVREKVESDALFLSIGEGAIVTDEYGRISRINKVALDILGYEDNELVGAWFPGAVIAEDEHGRVIANLERPITSVFLTGAPVSARMYYRRKDSSRVIVYLTVSPVMLDGKPIGAIEVFRNITREFELEQAKDEFISLASHQLRTPATAVKQYAGMLLQGYAGKLTAEQLRMAQTIYDCNERQITIVNDLLRVAQVDAGQVTLRPQEVELTQLVGEIMKDVANKFAIRHQTVTYDQDGQAIHITLDPQLMRMVLDNIIDNASKYTPEGKAVAVRVRQRKAYAAVYISDQGVGISKKDVPQIFQKFSRLPNSLSNAVGGTGLGLYWAKKIVDLHGGSIKVRPNTPQGTTFIVEIPLAAAPVAAPTIRV